MRASGDEGPGLRYKVRVRVRTRVLSLDTGLGTVLVDGNWDGEVHLCEGTTMICGSCRNIDYNFLLLYVR